MNPVERVLLKCIILFRIVVRKFVSTASPRKQLPCPLRLFLCSLMTGSRLYLFIHFHFQIFIDRDPEAFVPILNFLRTKELDTRYCVLDTRYCVLDTRYCVLDTRYCVLVSLMSSARYQCQWGGAVIAHLINHNTCFLSSPDI